MSKYAILAVILPFSLLADAVQNGDPIAKPTAAELPTFHEFHEQCKALSKTKDANAMLALVNPKIFEKYTPSFENAARINNEAIRIKGEAILITSTPQAAHDYYISADDFLDAAKTSAGRLNNLTQAISEQQRAITQSNGWNSYYLQCELALYKEMAGQYHASDISALLDQGTKPLTVDCMFPLYKSYDPSQASKADAIAFYTKLRSMIDLNRDTPGKSTQAPLNKDRSDLIQKCSDQIAKLSN